MLKKVFLLTFFSLFSFGTLYSIDYKAIEPGPSQAILVAEGTLFGSPVTFNCDFAKDPNKFEKKYSGLKSSKGGHSFQLVCYNKDNTFFKFWVVGLKETGEVKGLASGKEVSKTPHITLHLGKGSKILKEKAQDKSNKEITVNIVKYELYQEKGEALLQGAIYADWGINGNITGNFNVLIKDIGLTAK